MNQAITYVFESPMIEGGDGVYPCRIVAYKRHEAPFPERPYATHMEVFPDDNLNGMNLDMFRTIGHYDLTLEEAVDDAIERYEREGGIGVVFES